MATRDDLKEQIRARRHALGTDTKGVPESTWEPYHWGEGGREYPSYPPKGQQLSWEQRELLDSMRWVDVTAEAVSAADQARKNREYSRRKTNGGARMGSKSSKIERVYWLRPTENAARFDEKEK